MTIDWNLILRLLLAGVMGGLIGLERELRAKEAGFRTHFIVALGSALFMIISQFAFSGRFDAARVAAQVVSGIGFIGAGVIIFQKNVVRGVTTAAGLWVAAAIGLACGAGMFDVAGAAALMTVLCLELLHFFHLRYGEKVVDLTLKSQGNQDLLAVLDVLKAEKINVETYSVFGSKVHLTVRLQQRNYVDMLRRLVERLEGFTIEDMN
ncbi:MAG: MgtC/SapB family protein [Bacteroidales bacterium]|nr:MgtC/SapB family protein [Bacteroidales bacterium]